jgi:hypothetical protein
MNALLVILALFFQILVPGWVVMRRFRRNVSLSDAFAAGVLIATTAFLFFSVFLDQIDSIAFAYRITLVGVTIISFFRLASERQSGRYWRSEVASTLSRFPIFLSVITVLGACLFIVTHNIGFDDVAHLKYLADIKDETIFPVFIEVREGWSVARYPMFGLLVRGLTLDLAGGGFFGYYFFGLGVLLFFLAKVYEVVREATSNSKAGSATYLISLGLLVDGNFDSYLNFGLLDNYLNFGLYPLQQAKLIFLTGIVYLVAFARDHDSKVLLFLGGALIATSLIYHFNMLLLAPLFFVLGAGFLFVERKDRRGLLALVMVMAIPVLTATMALRSDGGFVRHYEPVKEVVVVEVDTVKPPKPALLERVWIRVVSLALWFKDGHYQDFYIARVYSPEIVLIPFAVLAMTALGPISILYPISIMFFALTFTFQIVTRVPVQAFSTLLQSGPWLIAADFWRSDIELQKKQNIYLTDAYTALVLDGLGYSNIVGLDSQKASQIFSPLIGELDINARNAVTTIGVTGNSSLLINSRYWGSGALDKFGIEDPISVPEIDQSLDRFINDGHKREMKSAVMSIVPIVREIVNSPLVEVSGEQASHYWNKPLRLEITETPDISYYRDSAIITIPNLLPEKIYLLDVRGVGDFFEVMIKKEGDRTFRNLPVVEKESRYHQILGDDEILVKIDHQAKKINVISNTQLSDLQVFVTLETGHLSGLGEIKEVKIE